MFTAMAKTRKSQAAAAVLAGIASWVAMAATASPAAAAGAMSCEFRNGSLRVSMGAQAYEKYVMSAPADQVKVACAAGTAAAVVGPYFVFFRDGQFGENYIGSNKVTAFRVNANMAAAVMGPYFVAAKSPSRILSLYVGSSSAESAPIAVAQDLAIAAMGSYLVASDGDTIKDEYVTSTSERPHVAAAGGKGAAIFGSYFVTYIDGRFSDTYVGASNSNAMIAGGGNLIAASMANYFVVLNGRTNRVDQSYVGRAGKVAIVAGPRGATAELTLESGLVERYDLATGSFY